MRKRVLIWEGESFCAEISCGVWIEKKAARRRMMRGVGERKDLIFFMDLTMGGGFCSVLWIENVEF